MKKTEETVSAALFVDVMHQKNTVNKIMQWHVDDVTY